MQLELVPPEGPPLRVGALVWRIDADGLAFLFSRGIRPEDVVNLDPGMTPFPESVLDMFKGELGWPTGGWPEPLWKVILGEKKFNGLFFRLLEIKCH